jgi:glycogen operon protein
MLATLMLSQGTAMLVAGDEFARTQGGNNNAYCQDNKISWLNWDIKDKGQCLIAFTRKLIGFRRQYPILRRDRFLDGKYVEELGVKDVTWINANGKEMEDEHWGDSGTKCFGMLLDGRAQPSGIQRVGHEATLLIVINAHSDLVNFVLPACAGGETWTVLLDTNQPCKVAGATLSTGEEYGMTAYSLLLFKLDMAANVN